MDYTIIKYNPIYEKQVQDLYLNNSRFIGQIPRIECVKQLTKKNWKIILSVYLLFKICALIQSESEYIIQALSVYNILFFFVLFFLAPMICSFYITKLNCGWAKHCIEQDDLSDIQKHYSSDQCMLVAIENSSQKVIGMIGIGECREEQFESLSDQWKEIELNLMKKLSVHPDWQCKGVGKALVLQAEKVAKEQGRQKLFLYVLSSNTKAINFYKRLGYTNVLEFSEDINPIYFILGLEWLVLYKKMA